MSSCSSLSLAPNTPPGPSRTLAGFSPFPSAPSLPARPSKSSRSAGSVTLPKPLLHNATTLLMALPVVTAVDSIANQHGVGRVGPVLAFPSGDGSPSARLSSRASTSGSRRKSATSRLFVNAGLPLAARSGARPAGLVGVAKKRDRMPRAGGSHSIPAVGESDAQIAVRNAQCWRRVREPRAERGRSETQTVGRGNEWARHGYTPFMGSPLRRSEGWCARPDP